MRLSQLLPKMDSSITYTLNDECEFDILTLNFGVDGQKCCTFIDDEKYISSVGDAVVMVLTTKEIAMSLNSQSFGMCIVNNPRTVFFNLHNFLTNDENYTRPTFDTVIGQGCNISHLTSISPKNVSIGNNVTIEEFVVIRENTKIADHTVIRAGTVIGGHGYEFKRLNASSIMPIAHLGGVVIGSHVEIQYNTCIDRAVYPWDNTVIGDYSKIDNLVHISHGVKMGDGTMVTACSSLGGRVVISNNARFGLGSTTINGIKVGESSVVSIGSVVMKDVEAHTMVAGAPARVFSQK